MFLFNFTEVFPHYFVPVIPALCIIVGVGVDAIADIMPDGREEYTIATLIAGSQAVLWFLVLGTVNQLPHD
ncbi:MAG: hypothetical protein AAF552_15045, partial [Pseudomonadota bacterium]